MAEAMQIAELIEIAPQKPCGVGRRHTTRHTGKQPERPRFVNFQYKDTDIFVIRIMRHVQSNSRESSHTI